MLVAGERYMEVPAYMIGFLGDVDLRKEKETEICMRFVDVSVALRERARE